MLIEGASWGGSGEEVNGIYPARGAGKELCTGRRRGLLSTVPPPGQDGFGHWGLTEE